MATVSTPEVDDTPADTPAEEHRRRPDPVDGASAGEIEIPPGFEKELAFFGKEETEAGQVAGFFGNIPMAYEINGKRTI